MADCTKDTQYLTHLAVLAEDAFNEARRGEHGKNPAVRLWELLDAAVADYTRAIEARANGPRRKMGEQETLALAAEDLCFALLLALARWKGKLNPADSRAFLVRLLDVRENEKSLEDLVHDERLVLWD